MKFKSFKKLHKSLYDAIGVIGTEAEKRDDQGLWKAYAIAYTQGNYVLDQLDEIGRFLKYLNKRGEYRKPRKKKGSK